MGWPHIVTEYGAVAQQLLPKIDDENHFEYDAIVVGSGMGGGVVAAALADEKKKVLVLEAGSLLFPTHVGNMPRPVKIGNFEKHIWAQYNKWSIKNYNNINHDEYRGAQAFNLGGRSMFWGSTIPSLAKWELAAWPKSIQAYLLEGDGYTKAKDTFNADIPVLRDFHKATSNIISESLGSDWDVQPAPVAVEYEGATEWSIPAGLFSTADLLLENTMTITDGVAGANPGICVNLNHFVIDVIWKDNKAIGVNCVDMCKGKLRSYYAKTVILAAGTLESAKIAMQSKINNPLVGVGITDHPIKYRHFAIKPEKVPGLSKIHGEKPQSTKLIVRHNAATINHYAFDIIVELGTEFNQGRYVDSDHIRNELEQRHQWIPCEIVVQFYSELEDCNKVTLGGWNKDVNVDMKRSEIPKCLHHQACKVASDILHSLEAEAFWGERSLWQDDYATEKIISFDLAELGRVAHEVGTMRMPVNGKKGVVDENLKVEGYENLYVCDNSVFPNSPAGNPSLTLVALARRCAHEVAQTINHIDNPHQVRTPVEQPADEQPQVPKAPIEVPVMEDGVIDEVYDESEISAQVSEIRITDQGVIRDVYDESEISEVLYTSETITHESSFTEIRSSDTKTSSVVVTAVAAETA